MPANIGKYLNADELRAMLPPGVFLWLIRGKVLHTELIERPIILSFSAAAGGGGQMSPHTETDTIIAFADRDDPSRGYEVRFKGRVTMIAPGDFLELLGHGVAGEPYVPRLALSIRHDKNWVALRPVRKSDKGFLIHDDRKKKQYSYHKEGDRWFWIKAPRRADAAPEPVTAALGKMLGNVSAPAAAPEPVKNVIGKLFGAASSKVTAASLGPALVAVDLWPVYQKVAAMLQASMSKPDTGKAVKQVQNYDSGDDLPPL